MNTLSPPDFSSENDKNRRKRLPTQLAALALVTVAAVSGAEKLNGIYDDVTGYAWEIDSSVLEGLPAN